MKTIGVESALQFAHAGSIPPDFSTSHCALWNLRGVQFEFSHSRDLRRTSAYEKPLQTPAGYIKTNSVDGRDEVYSTCVSIKKRTEARRQDQNGRDAAIGNVARRTGVCTRPITKSQGTLNMKCTLVTVATLLVMFTATAHAADETNALIALDKQWGESAVKGDTTVAAKLLADKVVSVAETGVRGKQGELADMKPEPAGTRYEPTDYKVTFINPDTAIMTHGTKGADAHYSLHVWSRKGSTWQVIATSTTPAKSGK